MDNLVKMFGKEILKLAKQDKSEIRNLINFKKRLKKSLEEEKSLK